MKSNSKMVYDDGFYFAVLIKTVCAGQVAIIQRLNTSNLLSVVCSILYFFLFYFRWNRPQIRLFFVFRLFSPSAVRAVRESNFFKWYVNTELVWIKEKTVAKNNTFGTFSLLFLHHHHLLNDFDFEILRPIRYLQLLPSWSKQVHSNNYFCYSEWKKNPHPYAADLTYLSTAHRTQCECVVMGKWKAFLLFTCAWLRENIAIQFKVDSALLVLRCLVTIFCLWFASCFFARWARHLFSSSLLSSSIARNVKRALHCPE